MADLYYMGEQIGGTDQTARDAAQAAQTLATTANQNAINATTEATAASSKASSVSTQLAEYKMLFPTNGIQCMSLTDYNKKMASMDAATKASMIFVTLTYSPSEGTNVMIDDGSAHYQIPVTSEGSNNVHLMSYDQLQNEPNSLEDNNAYIIYNTSNTDGIEYYAYLVTQVDGKQYDSYTPIAFALNLIQTLNTKTTAITGDIKNLQTAIGEVDSQINSLKLNTPVKNLTSAEYTALSTSDKNNGTLYIVT